MNLKYLSDETLLSETERLVHHEREMLISVLHHLKEIDRRRLFSALKYESLYAYATQKLGYPEDQAYRRIAAMKLLKEIPELEEKINSGKLNLTQMGLAQKLFNRERKGANVMSKSQKIEILEKLENKSTREAEKVVLAFSSEPAPLMSDKITLIAENRVEIKFLAGIELEEKIRKLKGMLGHTYPNITLEELFNKLSDKEIERLEKAAAPRDTKRKSQAATNRDVRRAGKCESCESIYALEIDHIQPRAMAGESNRKNLRLLCRSCNQRAAIDLFGAHKMESYLDRKHWSANLSAAFKRRRWNCSKSATLRIV